MQVAAADQRCATSNQQCAHLQRLNAEQLQHQVAAESDAADANSKVAAAVATATDMQQQLAAIARQRDDFSRQLMERSDTLDNSVNQSMDRCHRDPDMESDR